ncbi:glycoside hydrolase family 19 protein [Acinetobacter phage Ab69]|nr:glycoside hydrolase family 19 protein [Acinetobacter phage Ab69]
METTEQCHHLEEYGKGKQKILGSTLLMVVSIKAGSFCYGRGYVQLTWLSNYLLAKNKLGIDFVPS